MIEEIALENFKAFGEKQTISLAPLTLIYGQNSAGKSSIIQSLALMKQSLEADREVRALKPFVNGGLDLGSYKELVHEQNLSRKFSFGFSFLQKYSGQIPSFAFHRDRNKETTRNIKIFLVSCSLQFDCIRKEQIPYLNKMLLKLDDDKGEMLSFELVVVKKSKAEHVELVRENKPLDYKIRNLKFSEKFLGERFEWLKENHEFVREFREIWLAEATQASDAEIPEDVESENEKFRLKTKFYDKAPSSLKLFKKQIVSQVASEKLQIIGFENISSRGSFAYRNALQTFEYQIPFSEDKKNLWDFFDSVREKSFRRSLPFISRKSLLNPSFLVDVSFHRLTKNLEKSVFLGPIRSHPSRFYASGGVTPANCWL